MLGRRLVAAVLVLVAAFGARGADADAKTAAEEAKQRAKVAAIFTEAATWLSGRGRKAEAARAVDEARVAGADAAALEKLAGEVERLPATDAADPEAEKRWAKAAGDAAKIYDRLASLAHDPQDDDRFDDYLLKSVELDPSKARVAKFAGSIQQIAGNRARAVSVGRMLRRLRTLDAGEANQARCDALEKELASSDVALVGSPEHPLVAWLSLPKGAAGKVPDRVLIAVDGAGANFLGAARLFRDARGSRRFAILSPCALSCTNELKPATFPYYDKALLEEWNHKRLDFDLAGVEAILGTLEKRYGLAPKVAVTGFSGGGNVCYGLTMRNPSRVYAAVPACANYNPGIGETSSPVTDGGPWVHIFTGEKDEHREHVFGQRPGIEGQTDLAQEALGKLGFTRVKRSMLPGVGHSSCVREVFGFLDEVAAKR